MEPQAAERRMISMPPDWWAAFELAATRDGQALSEWLGAKGKAALPKVERRALSVRRGAGRPKK
jgi:hypothetical protein